MTGTIAAGIAGLVLLGAAVTLAWSVCARLNRLEDASQANVRYISSACARIAKLEQRPVLDNLHVVAVPPDVDGEDDTWRRRR